jgi:AcrR family transcriptional regulator
MQATRELLVELGYSRITMEAIAQRAGVGKPTVYRRWSSKAALAHEAVFPDISSLELEWDTGDFATDLRRHVRNFVDLLNEPAAVVTAPALLAEFYADQDLRDGLWSRLESPARDGFAGLVATAAKRGEVRSDVDAHLLFDIMAGTVLWRACAVGIDESFPDELASMLLAATQPDGAGRAADRRPVSATSAKSRPDRPAPKRGAVSAPHAKRSSGGRRAVS